MLKNHGTLSSIGIPHALRRKYLHKIYDNKGYGLVAAIPAGVHPADLETVKEGVFVEFDPFSWLFCTCPASEGVTDFSRRLKDSGDYSWRSLLESPAGIAGLVASFPTELYLE